MHLSRRGLLLGGGVRTLESFEPSALASLCRVERGDLRPFGDGFGVEYLACAWLAREVRHLHLTRLASEEHVTSSSTTATRLTIVRVGDVPVKAPMPVAVATNPPIPRTIHRVYRIIECLLPSS